MKRDMELVRKMILAVEDSPTGYAPDDLRIDGYTDDQLAYHAYLAIEGGLAKGAITTHMGSSSPSGQIVSLTWEGHDFAATAREDSRWRRAMRIIQEKGAGATIDIVKDVLLRLTRGDLGL